MYCPVCRCPNHQAIKSTFSTTYQGIEISIPDTDMYQCYNCETKLLTAPQAARITLEARRIATSSSNKQQEPTAIPA